MADTRPPATDRLYTFTEICEMLGSWGALPAEVGETNEEAVAGWVEHMRIGGFEIGLDKADYARDSLKAADDRLTATALRAEAENRTGYERDTLQALAGSREEGSPALSALAAADAQVFATLHLAHMVEELGKTLGSASR